MPDEYKKAYLTLFNAVTDALDTLRGGDPVQAAAILRQGQIQAEEAFIQAGEDRDPGQAR